MIYLYLATCHVQTVASALVSNFVCHCHVIYLAVEKK